MTEIQIRPVHPEDAEWITALAPRLHEFGPPPWRNVADMDASVAEGLAREVTEPSPGTAMFAAVDSAGIPLGFVSLRTEQDYFSHEPVGHVVDIVVTHAAQGRGVGRALLAAAERWAIDAGFPYLSLNVFVANERARRVYEQVGYEAEWTRMVKPIRGVSPHS